MRPPPREGTLGLAALELVWAPAARVRRAAGFADFAASFANFEAAFVTPFSRLGRDLVEFDRPAAGGQIAGHDDEVWRTLGSAQERSRRPIARPPASARWRREFSRAGG